MNGSVATAALHSPPHGRTKDFSPLQKLVPICRLQKDGGPGEPQACRALPNAYTILFIFWLPGGKKELHRLVSSRTQPLNWSACGHSKEGSEWGGGHREAKMHVLL